MMSLLFSNIVTENGPCEDVSPLQNGDFQLAMLVPQRVLPCIPLKKERDVHSFNGLVEFPHNLGSFSSPIIYPK